MKYAPSYFDYQAQKQGLPPAYGPSMDVVEFVDPTTQVQEVRESERAKFMQAYEEALRK